MLREAFENIDLDLMNPAILVAVLAFTAVVFVGVSILFLHEQRRKAASKRLLESDKDHRLPVVTFQESRLLRFVEQVGNYVSHGRASASLWEQLVRAGYMGRGAPAIYTGIKLLLFTLGISVTIALILPLDIGVLRKTMMISLGGAVPFFLPNLFIRIQEDKRRQEISQYLPDAVDLLEICVSSGIGLDMAWNMVAEEIHHVSPVLGNAMDLSNFEIHLGASRTEAMRNMAIRTGAESLSSLAAILVQTERFGTSIATALQEFANWMREERHFAAEEKAEKLPAKLLFPMAFLIFPALMAIALGPAMIQITRHFMTM